MIPPLQMAICIYCLGLPGAIFWMSMLTMFFMHTCKDALLMQIIVGVISMSSEYLKLYLYLKKKKIACKRKEAFIKLFSDMK